MAEFITLKQAPGSTVTAGDDRIVNDINIESGIIYGCDVSYLGNNMIHINAGFGIIKGGLFEIEDHTIYVDYSESGTTDGQIYLHLDLAAQDKLTIIHETTNTPHVLIQNDDANFDTGVYEIQICTFKATTTALTDVTQTWPVVQSMVQLIRTKEDKPVVLTATLAAGETTISFTNAAITSTASLYLEANKFGVAPSNAVQSGTTITYTFDAQDTSVALKLVIREEG